MLSSLSLLDVITGTGNTSSPSPSGLGGLLGDLVVPELAGVALEDIFGKGVGIVGALVIMIGGLV